MKFVKGIGIFLVYPLLMLAVGFFVGVKTIQFFYPGGVTERESGREIDDISQPGVRLSGSVAGGMAGDVSGGDLADASLYVQEAREVLAPGETLSADTSYVLEETDVLRQTVVETTWRLPKKYIGMNREQFLAAIEAYGEHPPLSELERGFVGLEVLSFSRERVVVQMNYEYLQPGEGFYLAVQDNEVVVYLEDQETVYIETGILLDRLPEEIQLQVIQMKWMDDEESLYGFLETYSS